LSAKPTNIPLKKVCNAKAEQPQKRIPKWKFSKSGLLDRSIHCTPVNIMTPYSRVARSRKSTK
jgi:hypothetical protein